MHKIVAGAWGCGIILPLFWYLSLFVLQQKRRMVPFFYGVRDHIHNGRFKMTGTGKQQFLFFDNEEDHVTAISAPPLPDAAQPDAPFEEKVQLAIESIIREFEEKNHLVVGTSFGKESSAMSAIVCRAMLIAKERGIAVPHVVFAHALTTYDNPAMDEYALGEMSALKDYIAKHDLPASMEVQKPTLSNDYLVNVMGGRMLATLPGTGRACADMLKVQTNKQLKKRIRDRLPGTVTNVVGKRWDESDFRANNMSTSGERPDMAVMVRGERLLTPIAHFTLDDLWLLIGMVKMSQESESAAAYKTYSDFHAMTEIYRDAMGGECMINAFGYGKTNSTGCSARFGCWTCTQVENDKSLENMVAKTHPHFKPLMAIRQFLLDHHWNVDYRRWLSREPNEKGELEIAPNVYSPDFCRHLLRCVVTAQVEENERAFKEGTSPAFEIIDERRLMAVQALWCRYGMHEPWAALSDWHAIHDGKRYHPWQVESPALRSDFPSKVIPERLPLTLMTGHDSSQMTSPALAMATFDDESIEMCLNGDGLFDIDEEGAELFVWILGPEVLRDIRNAVPEVSLRQEYPEFFSFLNSEKPALLNEIRARSEQAVGKTLGSRPSDVIRKMLNVGFLKLREADRHSWEKSLTIADSLAWYNVSDVMDNPEALRNIAKSVKRYGGGLEPPHLDRELAEKMRGTLNAIQVGGAQKYAQHKGLLAFSY